jgi:hypothetical protein
MTYTEAMQTLNDAVPCRLAEVVARTVDDILNTAEAMKDSKAVA